MYHKWREWQEVPVRWRDHPTKRYAVGSLSPLLLGSGRVGDAMAACFQTHTWKLVRRICLRSVERHAGNRLRSIQLKTWIRPFELVNCLSGHFIPELVNDTVVLCNEHNLSVLQSWSINILSPFDEYQLCQVSFIFVFCQKPFPISWYFGWFNWQLLPVTRRFTIGYIWKSVFSSCPKVSRRAVNDLYIAFPL